MLSLDQALTQIINQLPIPTKTEIYSITDAVEHICAETIISPINVPSFDNSAMDGYAVRLTDLEKSMTLPLIGKSLAGNPFHGEWNKRGAIRIMTGAMIPTGTDAVVMQEHTIQNEDGSISLKKLPVLHQNIRYIGEDVKQGEVVLPKGSRLHARSLPLLASLGISEIKVYPRIKVALFSTGNELVPVGNPLDESQIYDINRFTIKLMLEKLNCEILDLGILPDNEIAIEMALTQAQHQVDLIITSGGVSVGEADFVKKVLDKIGKIDFWKIAIKPGKPFAFGKIQNAWFCGLPGNPVSALVTFYQIVQPLIAQLSGLTLRKPTRFNATTTHSLRKTAGRLDFQRGFYKVNENGEIQVQPVGHQGSHLFKALVESNCFIVLEEERGNISLGETVTIEPFNYILE